MKQKKGKKCTKLSPHDVPSRTSPIAGIGAPSTVLVVVLGKIQ